MIGLYRTIFLPGLLLLAPRMLHRMARRGGYERDWPHRFGIYRNVPPRREGVRRIWLQAVSVGEVLALEKLLRELHANPACEVILTTTTSTGYSVAREKFTDLVAYIGHFPIDFLPWSARAWATFQPDLAVLMESELWPEHLYQARRRKVPAVLLNARLSDRSNRRYARFPGASRWLLQHLDRVLASSEESRQRFVDLGFDAARSETLGNLKFDTAKAEEFEPGEKEHLLEKLGLPESQDSPPLVLGASTWPTEEEALINLLTREQASGRKPFRLLLVPRHAERRREIRERLLSTGLPFHFRSEGPAPNAVAVAVADTTGELRRFTALADVAVIGKSFPPAEGGQTPLEAAAAGIPILFGPAMSNFREAARGLVQAGAAEELETPRALETALLALLQDPEKRRLQGQRARAWHAEHGGTSERVLAIFRRGYF